MFLQSAIPYELRTFEDLSTFKKKLKTYLFEKSNYLENLVIKSDNKVSFNCILIVVVFYSVPMSTLAHNGGDNRQLL